MRYVNMFGFILADAWNWREGDITRKFTFGSSVLSKVDQLLK